MKKLYYIFLLLTVAAYSQSESSETKQDSATTAPTEIFRAYYIIPTGIGDNVLAKANNGKAGIGLAFTFYNINNFGIFAGAEHTSYDITDASLTANASKTNLTSFYLGSNYRLTLGKRFIINPDASIAYTTMKQRDGSEKFGKYGGPTANLGVSFDFIIFDSFRLFAGATYGHTWYSVNTAAQYEDFYQNVNTINFKAGIKL